MVVWLGFIAIASVFYCQAQVDQWVWGTRLTPGVLLSGGYVAIAGIYAFASEFYEMLPVSPATYCLLCAFGVVTLIISVAVAGMVGWKPCEMRLPPPNARNGVRWTYLGWSVFYVVVAGRVAMGAGGLWSADSKDALGGGLLGHAHVVLAFLMVWYAVSTGDRGTIRYPMLAIGLVALSLNPVKGWILIPVLAVAINETMRMRSPRSGVLPIAAASLVGVIVFFGIYLTRAEVQEVTPEFADALVAGIFEHFLFYLTAGFVGLNAVVGGLHLPGGFDLIFAPVTNSVNALTGDPYVNIISDVYIQGLVGHGEGGNVFSMLGSLIGHIGFFAGMALSLALVAAAYLIFAISVRLRSGAAMAGTLYMLALFSFGWFDYYFWLLTVYEVAILALGATLLQDLERRQRP